MNTSEMTPQERQALMEELTAFRAIPEDMGEVEAKPTKITKATKIIKKAAPKKKIKKIIQKASLILRSEEECDEDELSTEAFEEICLQYEIDNAAQNDAKKKKDEGREIILSVLSDKKKFATEVVEASWSETKSDSVDMALVYDNLEAEEMAELVQLGLMKISKPNFERWAKGKGYEPEEFIIKGTPTKRLTVKRK